MTKGRFIAYFRVSTERQGRSGLGLEAQRKAVLDYLNGGQWELVEEVIEVESGKKADRTQLTRALALCKVHGATLVIAKLDRLARNVAFIANLMDSGVEFVAVDFPQANRLTLHILAAVAEHERVAISERTKAALAAAKARGRKLGNPGNLKDREKGRVGSLRVRQDKAMERAADLGPILKDIGVGGAVSYREMAAELNRRGIMAPRGGLWHAATVRRVMQR